MNNDNKISINNNEEKKSTKWFNNEFFEKLKKIKHLDIVVLLILVAIIICVYCGVKDKKATEPTVTMNDMEIRLSNILNEINGVSEAKVFINYENAEKSDAFFGDKTESKGKITGVVVVAKGLDSVTNRMKVLRAVQVALNINEDIIEVLSI